MWGPNGQGASVVHEAATRQGGLLNCLAKVYISPDAEFTAPKSPGYIVRYSVDRIGGVGLRHRSRAEVRADRQVSPVNRSVRDDVLL